MALPSYTPSGSISFGSVPWDNGYRNVRLYGSVEEQRSDIASMMLITTDGYAYVGRNRRLKVSVPADRLYHCNYCMYLNQSVTRGWVYCFVTDVEYVNDNTSEVTLETDVFQTFLYGTDWTVPPCFIDRMTVPSESDEYLMTPEPDFPLVYVTDGRTDFWFELGGYVVQTAAKIEENSSLIDDILNPEGYYAEQADVAIYKSIPDGCPIYFCPLTDGPIFEPPASLELAGYLEKITKAGSIDSVVSIYSVCDFIAAGMTRGFQNSSLPMEEPEGAVATMDIPNRGVSVNGYRPRNRKILYYPYTFVTLTDFNGNYSELRYELMDNGDDAQIHMKTVASPACKLFAYPDRYQGMRGFAVGITTNWGAVGSWSTDYYETWLAQNQGTLQMQMGASLAQAAAGALLIAGSVGGTAITAGAATPLTSTGIVTGASLVVGGAAGIANVGAQKMNASHMPDRASGNTSQNVAYATGMQGVHAVRMVLKAEYAAMIDGYFDMMGYAVQKVDDVNISSRPSWNYVKTVGCSAKSLNAATSSIAPFTRGAGTPAAALAIINAAFDNGVTFWHTTGGFGDYSLANGV